MRSSRPYRFNLVIDQTITFLLLVLTVCTLRQLAQALTLGDAITKLHPETRFCIGLADDAQLLENQSLPYPVVAVAEVIDPATLAELSERYTPTEFVAAMKPGLIRAIIAQQPDCQQVIFLDPNAFPYQPFTEVLTELQSAQILLTPHLIAPPADLFFPDEKYLQNIGLYSADFLALTRSDETDRMLLWWENRVQTRSQIDFCESLCLDQLWLMHLPALFDGVRVIKKQAWHRAIWNWHEAPKNATEPLLWANFKGLFNRDEGLFIHQSRLKLAQRPDIQRLIATYKTTVAAHQQPAFAQPPVFGKRPEPPIVRGWRRQATLTLRSITRFVDTVVIK